MSCVNSAHAQQRVSYKLVPEWNDKDEIRYLEKTKVPFGKAVEAK